MVETTTRELPGEDVVCPFCRFENEPGAKVCVDCRSPLGTDEAVPPAPIAKTTPPGQEAAALPPRLVAKPPVEPKVTGVGFAKCPACEAKNTADAATCGRCGAAIPPPGVAAQARTALDGTPAGVGVPGVFARAREDGSAPAFGPPPASEVFVPEALARERREKADAKTRTAHVELTAALGSKEQRFDGALWGGVIYGVVALLVLPWMSEHALETAPLHVLVGAAAGHFVVLLPTIERGTGAYMMASLVSVLAASPTSAITTALVVLLAAAVGGSTGGILREARVLHLQPRREQGITHAERRHAILRRESARLRAMFAGALAFALAFLPCALAREPVKRPPMIAAALAAGIFAVGAALGRRPGEPLADHRARLPSRLRLTFVIAGAIVAILAAPVTPILAILGVIATAALGAPLARGLERVVPGLLATEQEALEDAQRSLAALESRDDTPPDPTPVAPPSSH